MSDRQAEQEAAGGKRGGGCLRPLLISGAVLLAFTVGLVAWNWDTFALMLGNMSAMAEGGEAARALEAPADLLDYVAAHPEHASLVVLDVGATGAEPRVRYQATATRAVTGVPALALLTEYARQVEADQQDPAARVARDSVAAFRLPNMGRASAAAADSARSNRVARTTASLDAVVRAALRGGDEAAADWLLHRLGGRDSLGALPARLGLPGLAVPLPQSGLHLAWKEAARKDASQSDTLTRTAAARRAHALAAQLRRDSAFGRRQRAELARRGARLSLRRQRALAGATYPRGTARTHAALLARALIDSLFSPSASRRVRAMLERTPDSAATGGGASGALAAIGSEAGAFPGLVSVASYARRRGGAPGGRVAVLFLEDLPTAVFYRLVRTGIAGGLVLQLLADDAFLEEARQRLAAEGDTGAR